MLILQIATSRSIGFACAIGLALWASPASAGTTSFSYPTLATSPSGSGASISAFGIGLPSTGTSGFHLNFNLPRDYVNNGRVKIVMQLLSGGTPCTTKFGAYFLIRTRAGRPRWDGSAGLTATNGSPTIYFPGQDIIAKVFSLVPDPAFPGQRGGDSFLASFRREAGDATDNCSSNLFVNSIEIIYPRP